MPFVTSTQMLLDAQRGRYAVGAFNIENMEMAQAVIEAAVEARAPVMLQTTPSTVRYASPRVFAGIVAALAGAADVPVALHLDHGESFALAEDALAAGYTSLMIDGSGLPLEENATLSRRVVEMAAGRVPIEAELGRVGGKEDDLVAEADAGTDPAQAAAFVAATGVSSLAIAIGTAHGFYAGTPVLDKQRLSDIRAVVDVPLVLHGASGLPNDDVRDCITRGICKVNFATELRAAYTDGVREALAADPDLYDPKKLGQRAKQHVKALVLAKIAVCGCGGKA